MNKNIETEKTVISVLVNNHAGVLLRIAGLFSRRGFNIQSLTVCETENQGFSRMTIVAEGDEPTLKQISRQLYKLEDVHKVAIVEPDKASVAELLLIKIEKQDRVPAILEIAHRFGAKVIDIGEKSITLELSGRSDKISRFMDAIDELTIIELARTGISALERGDSSFADDFINS